MRVALAQMLVEGGQLDRNLQRAELRIGEAARLGAELALLPEALDFGWTHPSALEGAGSIPDGKSFQSLAQAARKNRVCVCAGLIERDGPDLFNSAVIIDRNGNLLAKHRKINELNIAQDLYTVGESVPAACQTDRGRLGLQICADGFAENQWISRKLCEKNVDIIVSPCAWAVDRDFDPIETPYGGVWRDNFIPIAREFGVWILACSNVGRIEAGPWKGRLCIGNSLGFDPSGREVLTGAFGEDAEELLMIETD